MDMGRDAELAGNSDGFVRRDDAVRQILLRQAPQELDVFQRNRRSQAFGNIWTNVTPHIRSNCRCARHPEERPYIPGIKAIQECGLVVPAEGNNNIVTFQGNQVVDYLRAVASLIYVVTEEDDLFDVSRAQNSNHRLQGWQAAVNVANECN